MGPPLGRNVKLAARGPITSARNRLALRAPRRKQSWQHDLADSLMERRASGSNKVGRYVLGRAVLLKPFHIFPQQILEQSRASVQDVLIFSARAALME